MDFKRKNKDEIKKFFERCKRFNWFYGRSEDINLFRKGHEAERKIFAASLNHPVLNKIYNDFFKWANKGGTKPELKNYI